jgi:hypothetical protein
LIVTVEPSHDTVVEPSGLTTTFMAFSASAARRSSLRRLRRFSEPRGWRRPAQRPDANRRGSS